MLADLRTQEEICNGRDDDCDTLIDENPTIWYADCDLDGVPTLADSITSCTRPAQANCTLWVDMRPTTSDCNDNDPRYSPNVAPFESSNGPNEAEEESYAGDMNCDGLVEKPSTWEYWDTNVSQWKSTSMPMCPASISCAPPNDCYGNEEAPGTQLGCGNTEISINHGGRCAYELTTARLRCR